MRRGSRVYRYDAGREPTDGELAACDEIRLAPDLSPGALRRLLDRARGSRIRFRIGEDATSLRPLRLDDLIDRVPFESDGRVEGCRDRRVLVTGAAGSIGSELCRRLIELGAESVIALDWDGIGLHELDRRLRSTALRPALADTADRRRVAAILERYRPQEIVHCAAHKQVPLMESAPCEAVKTNVRGTLVVAELALRGDVERLLYVSSDKAVRPASVMGATKRVGESVVLHGVEGRLVRRVVRCGNVLGSRGSVVPLFLEQLEAGGPLTLTDSRATRLFITVEQTATLLLGVLYGEYQEISIPRMGPPLAVRDLARYAVTLAGSIPEIDVPIVSVGLRPGEKLHEELYDPETESLAPVDSGIAGVRPASEGAGFPVRLGRLIEAAEAEDEETVRRLLRGMARGSKGV